VWLALAINAETAEEKRERALRGIEANERTGDDPEFRCLLLRQLFLAEFEDGQFTDALTIAEEMIELGELADVSRQDAARACLALGDTGAAVGHLRIAARICPPSRRPFHDWTLGSLLYLEGDWDAAVAALSRAARWATTQKPLYEAQLGLAQRAAGHRDPDLTRLRRELEDSPCAAGYGALVLGELCLLLGDESSGQEHLRGFVERLEAGRRSKAATLQVELAYARELLAGIR
jgi:tetratricopeptide (TPR) repeat protein